MMGLLTAALCVAALLLIGIDSERHRPARLGHARPLPLRPIGWLLLPAGFVAAVAGWGWVFGPIVWIGTAMAAAAASVLLLNLLPPSIRWPRPRG